MCNIIYGERGERDVKLLMFASSENRDQYKRKPELLFSTSIGSK